MARWSLHESDWLSFTSGSEAWLTVSESRNTGKWRVGDQNLDDSGFLPQDDSSVDNLALLLAPNRLSMAMLYMLFSEARRVVRSGGQLLIVTKDAPVGIWEKVQAFFSREPGGLRPQHYISPEHWQMVSEQRETKRGTPLALATFRRTNFT